MVGTVLFQTEKHLLYFMKREQEKEREAERRKAVWKILGEGRERNKRPVL